MKKTFLCIIAALSMAACAISAQASMVIDSAVADHGGSRIVSMLMASLPQEQTDPQMQDEAIAAMVDANMLIAMRFPFAQYQMALGRVGSRQDGIVQSLRLYQDGKTASMAVIWNGEQADGTRGSSVQSLALDLNTGAEITLDMLFSDPEAAFSQMEMIIEEKIVGGLSDYMEYAELLPMPRDSFSYDEAGLTVYYPQERYLYFSGSSGAVHFAWHEIDHLIAADGPAGELSREMPGDALRIEEQVRTGRLNGTLGFGVGDMLGDALAAHRLLADPDYTTDSLVYQFEDEALRGFALEIPKYAETEEEKTPISAVRSTRAQMHGLVTGETTREQAKLILGEPEQTCAYDTGHAADRMLEPGESWFYSTGGHILQLHFDEGGVLSVLSIRNQMPENWL
ncbi:MAG: hypothetical protein IKU34_03460 [Clostridia bacterium]|nr:hypothetical protein [Clostridia bacterium]